MSTRPSVPTMQKLYAVGCALLLGTAMLFAGSAYFWVTQPVASEAQIQAAAERVAQGRSEMPTSCPRPVLRGVALPGDGGEGLRAATDRFGICNIFLRVDHSAVEGCATLDTEVQAVLQRESGCTAQPLFLAGDMPEIQGLKEGMFILARARIHDGHLQEGSELLLDVIRLGQDLTRGRVDLATAHEGLEVQSEAAQQLEELLADEVPWTAAMLDELARQANVLVASIPEPTAWFPYEALSARQRALEVLQRAAALAVTEGAMHEIAVEDYAETRWPACVGVTLQACSDRYRVEIADVSARVIARYRWDWIPGVERQTGIETTYVEHLREREHVLTDAARTEALLRALPALFLHRRMSLSGTCPSAEALQAEARAAGVAEGFEIVASNQSILLWPPGVSTSTWPETELLYRAYCPARRAP